MDYRQIIENWRKSNNKGEAEMASILGLGKLQQNYNDFKIGRKKTFPFEAALAFLQASGINLLDFTTFSRENREGEKEERTELQIIDSLSRSTENLEIDHSRLVRSHEMLVETK